MKDNKKMNSFWRSLLAMVLVLSMMATMSVVAFADEEEPEATDVVVDVESAETEEKGEESEPQLPAETVNASDAENADEVSVVGFYRDGRYVDYYTKYADKITAVPEIKVSADLFAELTAPAVVQPVFEGRDQVLVMSDEGSITYKITVAETGMYAMQFDYFQLLGDGNGKDYELAVYVDGALPHNDADRFSLKRNWKDEDDERKKDSSDNELHSKQIEDPKWLSNSLRDPDGVFDDPAMFYLTAGEHEIKIVFNQGILALDAIRLYNDGEAISYADYLAENDANGAVDSDAHFYLQTENYDDKSESLIQPDFDRSDPKVTPYSISKTRMNVLGGENWNGNGQRVNWTINVPEDGYYTIGVRYRQSYVEDTVTYRKIYIDDVVPFAEAEIVGFPYGIGYQYKVIGGTDENGNDVSYKFYLTAGEHKFSMEGVIGPMEEVTRVSEDLVYQLNYIYRKIIIITGQNPDVYRDYELDKKIDGLMDMFSSVYDDLLGIEESVIEINGNLGSAQIITTLKKQLADLIEAPYAIPEQLSTFKDNISTLSTWMLALRDQPLQIDKMVFAGEDAKVPSQTANFWEGVAHEVRAFWSSFVDDYTTVGTADESARSLKVWVGTGRDQATVLKTLCDNYFTPQTGISVNVGLVPLTILSKAIVAGRCPDIALHVSRAEPMNLGVRNAIYDLTQFEDFDEVIGRFSSYAMTPYTLSTTDKDGNMVKKVFALPESQNFNMMFYRKDIFAELGISAPNTWDDFDDILPYIQANNMTVGMDATIQNGSFYTFILQTGNTPYAETGEKTNFTEQYAIDAFEKWTRYYLQYDLPTDYNWYTYFRNGQMPLVIQPYSQITYLQESAPELSGLWDVAPIPGTLDPETGIVNRTEESSTLSACMIVDKAIRVSKDPEQKTKDAWEFLKWWTSTEISAEYGNRIEMAIGSVARFTTSNIEAFEKIRWSSDEAAAIRSQREWVRELPELVGGYYVGRNIINAFRNVTNNNSNPREKLFYYNEEINGEIWRKRMEYDLSVPEEARK